VRVEAGFGLLGVADIARRQCQAAHIDAACSEAFALNNLALVSLLQAS
jgi:hypothetical protein